MFSGPGLALVAVQVVYLVGPIRSVCGRFVPSWREEKERNYRVAEPAERETLEITAKEGADVKSFAQSE